MKTLAGVFFTSLCAVILMMGIDFAQAKDKTKEEAFVSRATILSNFEIESSQLALKKSKSTAVRAFAKKAVDDHERMSDDLKQILDRTKIGSMISFQQLDDEHQDKLEDLGHSAPSHFDEDYIDAQLVEHDNAITLFEDYESEGKNQELKTFAIKYLIVLKQHQSDLKKIESSL